MPSTVVIWDSLDANVQFFVVERDLSHLNHKYANAGDNSDDLDAEISLLMYNEDTGAQIIQPVPEFPIEAVKAGAIVITTGFLP